LKDDYAVGFMLLPVSLAAGWTTGACVNSMYDKMTPEEQAQWDSTRFMHHGTLGLLTIVLGGVLVHPIWTPTLIGLGIGCAISDAKDLQGK
jgi:hypothetical protein